MPDKNRRIKAEDKEEKMPFKFIQELMDLFAKHFQGKEIPSGEFFDYLMDLNNEEEYTKSS